MRSLWIVVLLALALAHTILLSQPVAWLVGIVPDDAFYYFQIARHLARGNGSTFDGVHSASGYHPGWMASLVPLAAVLRGPAPLLRGALALQFLLHAATAVVLTGFLRRLTSPRIATIGGLCWLANPWALFLSLQGVEASLYSLSLVVLLRTEAALHALSGEPALVPLLKLGGALALCFLARTEAAILAAVTCLFLPWLRGRAGWRLDALVAPLAVAATFAACTAPWFLYSWMATGSPWQSSGTMKRLWADQLLGALGVSERLTRAGEVVSNFWLVPPFMNAWTLPFLGPRAAGWAAVALGLLGLAVAALYFRDRRLIVWSAWLLAGTTLTGAVYGLFFVDLQVWYRMQPAFLLFVVIYVWIARAGAPGAGSRWGRMVRAGALCALIAYSAFKTYGFYRHPPVPYPWQADVYASQREFERRVPPGEAIGCFNAGIAAFFSERRIVNLDGLVNVSVVPYYRERRLERYLSDERIRYIADEEQSLRRATAFMARPLELRALASAPLRGWPTPSRWLWSVSGSEAR